MSIHRVILTTFAILLFSTAIFGQDQYAVLIGVEKYDPGTFENLKYSEEDATRLGEILNDYGFRTTVMTSQAESAKLQPFTAENILSVIKARVNSCAKNDTLLVSLSGHGIQFTDDEKTETGVKETYFCPSDADLGDKSTLIPISELIKLINSSKANRKLLLIDACRNEVISKAGQNKSSSKKIQLESIHESRKSVPGGMSVLFSCSSEQFSWESNELERSVFSHFVTEYFDGNAEEQFYDRGKLTLDQMVAYVRKKTNDYVFENNLSTNGQNPVVRGETANWPIATIQRLDSYKDASFELSLRHAKLGIPAAQSNVGFMYSTGREVQKDNSAAATWYRKAATQGDARGQNNLGVMYQRGYGVQQDVAEAKKWFLKAADQGFATAQFNYGSLLADVNVQGHSFLEAAKWYRKAAEQGEVNAQFRLGYSYTKGLGVEQDYSEAMNWYRKAATAGNAKAELEIGRMYRQGLGVSKSDETAMQWYLKAATQGLVDAQSHVGFMYNNGLGVSKDYSQAMTWFLKAAEQGDAYSQNRIGMLYENGRGVKRDYDEAVKWYRRAAEQDYASGQRNLGFCYEAGYGVERDLVEAMRWYMKAADQGLAIAQFNVGTMYLHGRGVTKDKALAKEWFEKSAAQGYSWAEDALKHNFK